MQSGELGSGPRPPSRKPVGSLGESLVADVGLRHSGRPWATQSNSAQSPCLLNGGKAHVGDTGSGRIERAHSGCVWNSAERGGCQLSTLALPGCFCTRTRLFLGSPTEGSPSPTLTPGCFSFSKLKRRTGGCHFLRGHSSVSPLRLSAFPAVSHQNLISGKGLSQNP